MNNATKVAATVLGLYAGLLGTAHGYFETLQGDVVPSGIVITAMGPPCQGNSAWHACLPAVTIVPDFFATGVLAVVFSLIAFLCAARFIKRKNGGQVLIALSILMFLVGGGFNPTYVGILAGVAGTRIGAPLIFWRTRASRRSSSLLAKLWPWILIVFVIWSFGSWVLGYFFNQEMRNLGFISIFFLDVGLPLMTVFTGFAFDARNHLRDIMGQKERLHLE
jgi:hypothetical protein